MYPPSLSSSSTASTSAGSTSLRSSRARTSASVRSRRARKRHAASKASSRRRSGPVTGASASANYSSAPSELSASNECADPARPGADGTPGVAAVSAAATPCGVASFIRSLLGGPDEGCGGRGVAFDRLDEVLVDAEDFVDLGLDLLGHLGVLVEVDLG